jgi:tripartite-type tricarboxylate transporter receptor subunit TctC
MIRQARHRAKWLSTALLAALVSVAAPVGAQEFPSRAMRFIVPFTPGTGMDNIARQVAEKMHARWGQPVIVENRLGAAGNLGAEMVARAPADGHTLLVTASNLTITAHLIPTAGFDPMTDLAPITIAAWGNQTLVVNPGFKAANLTEFLAMAKATPGKLTFASPGIGSPQHIALELLQQQTGTSFLHVPYKGTAPGVADVIAGHVDAMLVATHTVMPQVNAGRLRALGVAAQTRHRAAPDLPSFGEMGVPNFTTDAWYGFLAPRATPQPILEKLYAETRAIIDLPDVKGALDKTGLEIRPSTSAEMRAVMQREFTQYGEIIRKNGIRP